MNKRVVVIIIVAVLLLAVIAYLYYIGVFGGTKERDGKEQVKAVDINYIEDVQQEKTDGSDAGKSGNIAEV